MRYKFNVFIPPKLYQKVRSEGDNQEMEITMGPNLLVLSTCHGAPNLHGWLIIILQHLMLTQINIYICVYISNWPPCTYIILIVGR